MSHDFPFRGHFIEQQQQELVGEAKCSLLPACVTLSANTHILMESHHCTLVFLVTSLSAGWPAVELGSVCWQSSSACMAQAIWQPFVPQIRNSIR